MFAAPVDPYFKLPLWLQIECEGETLWAYNRRHLAYLRLYVEAKLRETGRSGHRTMGSKLPKWMLLAKNRDAVLKGIERLGSK